MITTILFDLDGTLTDPKVGITKSVQYSLKKFDIEVCDLDELDKFIGPPLKDSYMKFYGFTEDKATQAIDYFREYFPEKGIFENTLYPGIPELLSSLKQQGLTLAVATSKPTLFAEKIISHFKLDPYFDGIYGSNLDNTRTNKGEIIAFALDALGKKENEALMVGDRMHDIVGAKTNSLPSIGVLYGYGNREELEKAQADSIVATVEELSKELHRAIRN
jgi:phosphoglycolate phosphatase